LKRHEGAYIVRFENKIMKIKLMRMQTWKLVAGEGAV
jgi:hypothetical protein